MSDFLTADPIEKSSTTRISAQSVISCVNGEVCPPPLAGEWSYAANTNGNALQPHFGDNNANPIITDPMTSRGLVISNNNDTAFLFLT